MVDIIRTNKKKKKTPFYIGGGLVAVVVISLGLYSMEPAAPSVDSAAIVVDTVRRGEMLRQVRGPGNLVPEQIRWLTAVTSGRVEQVMRRAGAKVEPGTLLLVLTNPDVQLQALDAERQLSAAELELVNLTSSLNRQRLAQEAVVAQITSQYNDAVRTARLQEELAAKGIGAANEVGRARDQLKELEQRLEIEKEQLELLKSTIDTQLESQREQIQRLKSIVSFRHQQLASMNVRSETSGVLTQMDLEVGQWVNSGQTLARVTEPGRLKAVLRIPETQAKDIAIGQEAEIDTRNGIVKGRVVRIDPASSNATVGVDVELTGDLPAGARPDLSVDGTILIERLPDVLYVGRPAFGQQDSKVGLFKLDGNGGAVRTSVTLGRASVNYVEVVNGLKEGDAVILSDMTQWDSYDRVRIK